MWVDEIASAHHALSDRDPAYAVRVCARALVAARGAPAEPREILCTGGAEGGSREAHLWAPVELL